MYMCVCVCFIICISVIMCLINNSCNYIVAKNYRSHFVSTKCSFCENEINIVTVCSSIKYLYKVMYNYLKSKSYF